MQLSSIDRNLIQRPSGVDAVSAIGANRVLPVAPVNPSVSAAQPAAARAEPVKVIPSVINLVNQANKPNAGEGVYASVADPIKAGAEATTTQKDWTISRPEPVKQETPPPEPVSKLLMDFLRHVWRASGSAVEQGLTEHLQKLDVNAQNPYASPGNLAKEALTYSPSKIATAGKSQSSNSSSDSTKP